MEEQPKPLNVVTVELHNIVFANVTLQCYKWIYFADLTQNWWHTQILYAHSKVNFLQHIVFSAFCCLQKTLFKALNQSNRRFPPCAAYFRSSLHCKSTEQILRQSSPAHALNNSKWNKIALQNVWLEILLRYYNAEFRKKLTLQNSELRVIYPEQPLPKIMNEKANWNVTLSLFTWKSTFLSHVKSAIQLNSLSGARLFHITAIFWLCTSLPMYISNESILWKYFA